MKSIFLVIFVKKVRKYKLNIKEAPIKLNHVSKTLDKKAADLRNFHEFWSEFSGQLISAHISVHPNTYVSIVSAFFVLCPSTFHFYGCHTEGDEVYKFPISI